ncbi:hypothetical protein K488DRAFT_56756, partial [Vararia minispora EC-137]
DSDAPPPVHESLAKEDDKKEMGRAKRRTKARYAPPGETRDARTIFIGNVHADVVKSKTAQKQLKRHILSFVPSANIESVRFRSVAFQAPTTSSTANAPKPEGRVHERERAATWREKAKDKDGEEAGKPAQRLSAGEKKRIAFIKHEIHAQADAVHAYIVFAHADPASKQAANVLDPQVVAREVVEKADGSIFMGRTLRVDSVSKTVEEKGDPRRTVFVGNLDFASQEEDLRVFFEGVVSAERGPPGADEDEESDEENEESEDKEVNKETKPKTWVTRVRIVRDKDTLLGKGFAYVEFADRECVDELLAMEEGQLKFAKRKLRLQHCKTLPGSAPIASAPPKPKATPQDKARARVTVAPVSVPKGDPALGERLAHMSKEARKAAKASDAARIARRLAKKKARAALSVPVKAGNAEMKKTRERKTPLERRAAGAHKPAAKKGRVRSEKSVAKRNAKK